MGSFALLEVISATKPGVAWSMAALAVSQCSRMSCCSWSEHPPRTSYH